ncbi:hypothetical protein DCCM_3257 [Desulfocucumis palustris]|uniref:Phage protein n=1 Tax=Desulfocucumis palustris TaxID=1898651 RepID=A0A2L2XD42_9FIRM|nr:hypothetical protein [Desulfocucumis palustris]GBF34145.1 hypothetical protein DCCM_3257 [Desulfocucumis palustris]
MAQTKMVYGPLELPSGAQIKFRAPLGLDRTNVLQMTEISRDSAISDAMLVDDYVAAKCVTEVDGKQTDGDYKRLMNDWPQQDIMFYRVVFESMFGINEDAMNRAKEAAAFLLKGQTYTGGSSSASTV